MAALFQWLRSLGLGGLLATAGWLLGRAGETIAVETALTETAVGVLLTGLASSLAELVVSIAAIRAGALTLAVSNIIGGNTFDTLLVGIADIAYRPGAIYGAVGEEASLIAGFTTLATAVIVLGMLHRERHGIANIGMESAVVIAIYAVAVLLIL
jgi:cation:H+ antiporter